MTDFLGQCVDHRAFCGHTLDKLPVYEEMSPEMTWVFEAFKAWNPVVFGGSLRDLIMGCEPHDIDFIVDDLAQFEVINRLKALRVADFSDLTNTDSYGRRLQAPLFAFTYNGVKYNLVCRGNILSDHQWLVNDFSVNQLRAERPNEVLASRVAMYDLGHRQARITSRVEVLEFDSTFPKRWNERAMKLQTKGLRILPHHFAVSPLAQDIGF
jgi:hypothetical protein